MTSRADEPEAQRLRKIYDAVDALLAEHTIDGAAIERVYHNKNASNVSIESKNDSLV